MTMINLNNKTLNQDYNANSSVNDIIDLIIAKNENEVITEIELDGIKISPNSEEKKCLKTISNYQTINLTTKTSIDLAFEALGQCRSYIDILIQKIHFITDYFAQNKTSEANEVFLEVMEILDLFIQLMTRINKTILIQQNKKYIKSSAIEKLEIHLLSILKALIPAKEKNDIIMLCDLLEYELIDNLTQWKIRAIPDLKNIRP